jgi:ABC-type oligopeptide transport system substrate-binding subunit
MGPVDDETKPKFFKRVFMMKRLFAFLMVAALSALTIGCDNKSTTENKTETKTSQTKDGKTTDTTNTTETKKSTTPPTTDGSGTTTEQTTETTTRTSK